MRAAPSPSTASRSSSAFGPSTTLPGTVQYDSTSPDPAVGEKQVEEPPPSKLQRPVVVKCLVKTKCSSRSAGPPQLAFGSVCVVEAREPSRVSASV